MSYNYKKEILVKKYGARWTASKTDKQVMAIYDSHIDANLDRFISDLVDYLKAYQKGYVFAIVTYQLQEQKTILNFNILVTSPDETIKTSTTFKYRTGFLFDNNYNYFDILKDINKEVKENYEKDKEEK